MSLSDVIENYQASFVPPSTLQNPYQAKDYASRYFTNDPKERRMVLKINFIKSLAAKFGTEAKVTYQPGEEELQTIKHFQGQLTQATLDQWVWQMYDPPRDPGMGWVFANNFPEQRQRMIDLLNLKHDILEQLMVLKTKSFPDENDALLLFIINYMPPTERQRFLTWLVGNDRSPEVLKAIVGPNPTFPRDHNEWINSLNINLSGAPKEVQLQDAEGRRIPNTLWRKMSTLDTRGRLFMDQQYPTATNRADMLHLYDQAPLRGRVDYTKPTPYTANTTSIETFHQGRNRLTTFAPTTGRPIDASYFSAKNVQDRIDQMMSGLNLNQ